MGSKRFSRSVSIIGVGLTPFFHVSQKYQGISESELFAYAAREAFRDCGVNPRDVGHYYFANSVPNINLDQVVPGATIQDWAGLRGIGGTFHAEGCGSGYYALDLAVKDVASGAHDIVLTGCAEFADSYTDKSGPGYARRTAPMDEIMSTVNGIYDKLYTRGFFSWGAIFDNMASKYSLDNNLTLEQMDEIQTAIVINSRRNAEINPKAVNYQRPLLDEAKEAGFDDVKSYMSSPIHNPRTGHFARAKFNCDECGGGGVLILCPTDMARQFTDKPIEVYTSECCTREALQPYLEYQTTEDTVRLLYKNSDVTPSDIDLFYCNDFVIASELVAPEICGYIPKGECYKYFLEGRTCYDGDKPISPNGSRAGFGHANSVSGIADIYDAVKQMRGEAGAHQVKKTPKTTMIRGFGGGQNISISVLKSLF